MGGIKRGLAQKKKRENFKAKHPEGRKAFAKAKRDAKKNKDVSIKGKENN